MGSTSYDLVVIGAGPGGYVAAIRAAQLGLKVACVEKEKILGGTCLRIGCIPSKALLESSEKFAESKSRLAEHGVRAGSVDLDLSAMLRRKDGIVRDLTGGIDLLFKKNKITRLLGTGSLLDANRVRVEGREGLTELQAKNILIASGSAPLVVPGIEMDGDRIGTSTEALDYREVPKNLIVIGAGAIGLELGSVWSRLGSKVIVLEWLDRILPGMDADISSEALRIFKKQGLEFRLGVRVKRASVSGKLCIVECEGSEPLKADHVLVAVGRTPYSDGLGLDGVGIKLDEKRRIPVDEHFSTSAGGVFAIGDVIRGPMLAHKAEEEGIACVERIAMGYGHVNYDAIPNIVYTHPEIASVGKTEEDLKKAGVEFRKGSFPFRANGRARCLGEEDGRVKILADAKTDRVLGVHVVGPRAGDLIAEAAVGIEFGASSEDLARACHAHPTLSEAIKEAALAVDRRSIHF